MSNINKDKCHLCRSSPVAVIYAPDGCNCSSEPVQALCMQHLVKVHSAGPITLLEDLTLDKVFSNEKSNFAADRFSFDKSVSTS